LSRTQFEIQSYWSDRDKIVNSIIDTFHNELKRYFYRNYFKNDIYTSGMQDKFRCIGGADWDCLINLLRLSFSTEKHDEKHDNLFYVASTIPGWFANGGN
jgi:hypothetical protein